MRNLVAITVAAIALAAVACSGGDAEGDATTTPASGATNVSGQTPDTAILTPAVPPTIAADLPLVPYTATAIDYSFAYPEGWTVSGNAVQGDFFQHHRDDGVLAAELAALCTPGPSADLETGADLMLEQDLTILEDSPLPAELGERREVTVDGRQAWQLDYNIALGSSGARSYRRVVYTSDGQCGWRISMTVYGKPPVDSYMGLFDRVLETFHAPAQA